MTEYYDRWLAIKPVIEANTDITDKIKSAIEGWVGYRQIPRYINVLGKGTNNTICSMGSIENPFGGRLHLALRVPMKEDVSGKLVSEDIIAYENKFDSDLVIPFFAGVVGSKLEGLPRYFHAMLTEDLTLGGKLKLYAGECGEKHGVRVLENGNSERVYVDPEPEFNSFRLGKKYRSSALHLE